MTSLAEPAVAVAPAVGAAPSLWRSPGLATLFTASTTARLAQESARVSLVLLVLARTGSPALVGTVVGALALPALVTGPLLGAWLDRTPRRRLAFVANQVLLLVALLGLLAVTGSAPSWVVVGLALLGGLTTPVLTGGFTGLVAALVPAPLLPRAFGAESTSYNVAGVVGPALAGVLAGAFGAEAAVGATAALAALALAAVLRVPMPAPAAGARDLSLLRSVLGGLRLLVTSRPLRAVTVATTVSFTGMGALPVVFPLLARELGAGAAAAGALFSAFALGALVGSLAMAARAPRTSPVRLALVGVVALGLAFGAVGLAPTFPVALALVALAGVIEGPVLASTLMVRAAHSPAHLQSQVVTTAASLKFGGFAVGSAGTGLVVAASDVRTGIAVLAVAQFVGVGLGLLSLGRRRAGARR